MRQDASEPGDESEESPAETTNDTTSSDQQRGRFTRVVGGVARRIVQGVGWLNQKLIAGSQAVRDRLATDRETAGEGDQRTETGEGDDLGPQETL